MKILQQINKYLILIIIFLYPIFYLPFFPNKFDTSKLLLLICSTLIITIIKIVIVFIQKNGFKAKVSKLDLLIVGLMTVYLISGLLAPDKLDVLFFPGTASFVIFGATFYFFINQFHNQDKKLVDLSISLSATIYSIIHILSFTKYIAPNYNLFGNNISSLTFLLITLSISTYHIFRDSKVSAKIFFGVISFIVFIGAFTSLYLLTQKSTAPNLPGWNTSWIVTVDSIKQSPFLGVGPANFLYSYNKFRPLSSNMESNWTSKYLVASNTPLTVASEVGIIGVILFIGIFIISLNKINNVNPYKISILIALFISFCYPFSASLFPTLFIIFALNNQVYEVTVLFKSKIFLILMLVPILGLIGLAFFVTYKVFYGEFLFGNTLNLISQNKVIDAYNSINKTVKFNPYINRYHQVSSNINLALAQNISRKENVTDEDKKNIAILIQQSIIESKANISLNSTKSSSWENLGDIYINIASFSNEAKKFAKDAYNQAIFLDPFNPLLRIKLGSVYYSESNYEEAIKILELAVLTKPDLAKSYYDLALAYKSNKQLDKAKEQINIALKLLEEGSADYEAAKKELEKIEAGGL